MMRSFVVPISALAMFASLVVATAGAAGADPVDPVTSGPTSSLADALSASDQGTAQLIAKQFDHPVTVEPATTETELVKAEPDGSMRLTQDSEPVRVEQGEDWVPTDMTLTLVNGSLRPAASAVPVQFSAGGSAAMVKIQSKSGQWLSEDWQAGPLPEPTLSDDTATYPEVYPGVDLQLTATATGMSQVLVIKDAAAAANPALTSVGFGINDGSLTTASTPGGTTVSRAADGSAQLTSSTATWWDCLRGDCGIDGHLGL